MDLPTVNDLSGLDHIIMRVLSRRKAGMIGENAQPVTDLETVK